MVELIFLSPIRRKINDKLSVARNEREIIKKYGSEALHISNEYVWKEASSKMFLL